MLLSSELVAAVLIAFVLVKTGAYFSLPHKVRRAAGLRTSLRVVHTAGRAHPHRRATCGTISAQLLRGIVFWTSPTVDEIASILPRRFKRSKQRTIEAVRPSVCRSANRRSTTGWRLPLDLDPCVPGSHARWCVHACVAPVVWPAAVRRPAKPAHGSAAHGG